MLKFVIVQLKVDWFESWKMTEPTTDSTPVAGKGQSRDRSGLNSHNLDEAKL